MQRRSPYPRSATAGERASTSKFRVERERLLRKAPAARNCSLCRRLAEIARSAATAVRRTKKPRLCISRGNHQTARRSTGRHCSRYSCCPDPRSQDVYHPFVSLVRASGRRPAAGRASDLGSGVAGRDYSGSGWTSVNLRFVSVKINRQSPNVFRRTCGSGPRLRKPKGSPAIRSWGSFARYSTLPGRFPLGPKQNISRNGCPMTRTPSVITSPAPKPGRDLPVAEGQGR